MDETAPRIPQPRQADDDRSVPGSPGGPIPVAELPEWHRPGVHRIRLADREVWVRVDQRGIVSISTFGPERLSERPFG